MIFKTKKAHNLIWESCSICKYVRLAFSRFFPQGNNEWQPRYPFFPLGDNPLLARLYCCRGSLFSFWSHWTDLANTPTPHPSQDFDAEGPLPSAAWEEAQATDSMLVHTSAFMLIIYFFYNLTILSIHLQIQCPQV